MFTSLKSSYHFFILVILSIVFICIKISTLNIPFFWDEAWVYAPAIKAMAKEGISLLPNALADSYSRGHPLLFFATGATWVKLFGSSFFSMHLFALAVATCFIFTLFYITKKLFDSKLALIVTAITLAQPIFIAQSAITVPEIFLSLWAILTIYHFVKQNRYYYFLFGTFMMLTKESGVVIIASIMLYQAIYFFTQKITWVSFKMFMRHSLFAFVPLIPFIGFLIIQHFQRGYYMFPEHISLLNFNWHDFQERLKNCYDYMFEHQARLFLTWSFLIAFGLLYKPIPISIRWFIILGLVTCVKVFFRYWPLPDWLMILFVGIFTVMFYYFMHIKYANKFQLSERTLAILFIIGVLYLVFSSINFFSNRYLLVVIPLMILYFSYYIKESIQVRPLMLYVWASVVVSLFVCNAIFYCNTTGDDSPKYVDAVGLEQMIAQYLEQQNMQNQNIYCNFTVKIALTDTGSGYLSNNRPFLNTTNVFDKKPAYIIQTNIQAGQEGDILKDSLMYFEVVKKFNYGIAHGKLFKRIL